MTGPIIRKAPSVPSPRKTIQPARSARLALATLNELKAKAPVSVCDSMICSGTVEGGKTPCNGDSGGPLVVPGEGGG